MARQVIDTTTNNGTYIGDPAKTAFEKTNANFAEVYPLAEGALQSSGGSISSLTVNGVLRVSSTTSTIRVDDRTDLSRNWQQWCAAADYYWVYQGLTVRASLTSAGVMSAVSFNPTSSVDVKDYFEGYSDDACSLIDRLVVATYRYRPDFLDSGDKKFIGLLAENVHDVIPGATSGGSCFEMTGDDGLDMVVKNPTNIDMMQLLALSIRSHQQKSKKIKELESRLAQVITRMESAGI